MAPHKKFREQTLTDVLRSHRFIKHHNDLTTKDVKYLKSFSCICTKKPLCSFFNFKEMKVYVPDPDQLIAIAPKKEKKEKKDPNAPKRGTSSFFFYLKVTTSLDKLRSCLRCLRILQSCLASVPAWIIGPALVQSFFFIQVLSLLLTARASFPSHRT